MASRLTAKLVGEGFGRPNAENELPIDISYARLNEWLVDRKQVPADWNRRLQAIQAKAAEALRELPPGFLGQFEGGEDAPLDYFVACQVLGVLSETAERGLLGSLKGAAGSWDKVVRAYEHSIVHVAEAAQTLCRNADYEIPFLKKQAAKCQQQLADLERRKADALKSAAAAAADFRQECQQLGIDSADIKGGLRGLTGELPALVGTAIEALQAEPVTQALEYYSAMTACQQQPGAGQGPAGAQQGRGEQAEIAAAAAAAAGLLPVLEEVREGRTEAPVQAVAPAGGSGSSGEEESGTSAGLQVDWDLGAALEAMGGDGEELPGGEQLAAGGISWDLDAADLAAGGDDDVAPGGSSGAAGISWDVEVEVAEAGGCGADVDGGADGGADGAPAGIGWDIDISGLGEEGGPGREQQPGSSNAAAAAAEGPSGGSGAGATASSAAAAAGAQEGVEPPTIRRLIEDAAYRARLLDDLFELRAFLMQRCRELGGSSNELLAASAPEAVQQVSADMAAGMLEAVNAALVQFSGDKLKQFISLRTSPRFLDRLAAGLQQKAGQEAKFHRAAADAEQRRGQIQRQLMADSAKLAVLLKRTRQAKEKVESVLSTKLGRLINIMGEVNNLI